MLNPASLVTAGIVMVFAVFLMLLQTLVTQRVSETRSLPDVAKASFRAGIESRRVTARNPYTRVER
jgi:hypothetical protein